MLSQFVRQRAGWVIVGLAVLGVISLSWGQAPPLAPLALDRYHCEVVGHAGNPGAELRVLSSTNARAGELAEALCRSAPVADHYARVAVYWTPRGELVTEDLVSQRFDLIWRRERELRGLLNGLDSYYSTLQRLPDYSVFWISRNDRPELTKAYFSRKRVGLVRDTRSQSSYQLPVAQLQEAGIRLDQLDVHYYEERRALYTAFAEGQVDLISGLGYLNGQPVAQDRRLAIARQVSTGQWFISRRAREQGLGCSFLKALDVMVPLYQNIDPGYQPVTAGECLP